MSQLGDYKNNQFSPLTTMVSIAGLLGTLGAAFSDFFYPLAPYGLYIGAVLTILFLVSLLLKLIPPSNHFFGRLFNEYWYAPVGAGLLIFAGLFIGSYMASKTTDSSGVRGVGILASNNDIAGFQSSLLGIEAGIKVIGVNTLNTANNTSRLADSIDSTTWNTSKFSDAVFNGDFPSLQGHIARKVEFNPNATFMNLVDIVCYNNQSFRAIKLLYESGSINKIDLQKEYKDSGSCDMALDELNQELNNGLSAYGGAPRKVTLLTAAVLTRQKDLAHFLASEAGVHGSICMGYDHLKPNACAEQLDVRVLAQKTGIRLDNY